MDPAIVAAGRALAAGDPLAALPLVALRADAPGLALRGIAMAQLGQLAPASRLLRRAARAFGAGAAAARARCVVAAAEVALAARELSTDARELHAAIVTLDAHGERANALHGRLVVIRRHAVLGRLADAEGALAALDLRGAPPRLVAVAELVGGDLARRALRARDAQAALERARRAAGHAGIPALCAEVERAWEGLRTPCARLVAAGRERALRLDEVERVRASHVIVVDACRRAVTLGREAVALARRPVLFALVRALAEACPHDVPRDVLLARAFVVRRVNASHRARLRVDVGRLRRALRSLVDVHATRDGYVLSARRARRVVVLAPPADAAETALVALLADGEAWSTSALALTLGVSQRTVQRQLTMLADAGAAQAVRDGRARRWIAAHPAGSATVLLLPGTLAVG